MEICSEASVEASVETSAIESKTKTLSKKTRKKIYRQEKLRKEKEYYDNPPPGAITEGTQTSCTICNDIFQSKTKLFKHLESVHNYCNGVPKLNKYIILLGFISLAETDSVNWQVSEWACMNDSDSGDNDEKSEGKSNTVDTIGPMINGVRTIYDETTLRVDATLIAAMNLLETSEESTYTDATVLTKSDIDKYRSFDMRPKGYMRGSLSSQRSTNVFGVEESMSALCDVVSFQTVRSKYNDSEWITNINEILKPHKMRVLERVMLEGPAAAEFNAENACSQRVYEMLVPLQIMLESMKEEGGSIDEPIAKKKKSYNANPRLNTIKEVVTDLDDAFPIDCEDGRVRLLFFRKLKPLFKLFGGGKIQHLHNFLSGGGVPNVDKSKGAKDDKKGDDEKIVEVDNSKASSNPPPSNDEGGYGATKDSVLFQRKIDRIYHKGMYTHRTTSSPELSNPNYAVFSISGDVFLRGQARNILGLVLAVCMSYLPQNFAEVLLSNKNICDSPSIPGYAVCITECRYAFWESKFSIKFDPRRAKEDAASSVDVWSKEIYNHIAEKWLHDLRTSKWQNDFKNKCTEVLVKYTNLNALQHRSNDYLSSSLEKRTAIPALYNKVLDLLREADYGGNWPSSTAARRVVVETTDLIENGGKGGSFSIGCFPSHFVQPKGNAMFPSLVKHAFLLEKAICPHRRGSSTIAVNRHAQFRPHRDSGAGNGQSQSLIVALGGYAGGELVVEGTAYDIQYNPIEFDGWAQRHWTMPFVGERYSLVWFTPLGVSNSEIQDMRDKAEKALLHL